MANQEAADYYEDVLKSYEGLEESGFHKILESQEDLAATDKSDPLYSVLQDNVANNIMQYYILDSEEENLSDVSFQHVRDKYVEYYDSNNRPIDGDISYWIVEYKTPDGNVYQRRYQYNVDSDGDFSFTSLEIFPDATFESTSGTAVEKKQYVPTENTHAYEIKQDDGTRMLYAIDTATDTPVGIDIADEPKDESKPLKHEKGSTSKKYEKVEGSTTQDIVYKFSEDGKK
ncbi:MAG: hypothetical protein K6E91_00315 [Butyrivibrio sp.]|nr:hypothetical protein [Butyrivibrio sp.]